jgi:selenocysteine lyase/cysteine desulfurase
MGDPEYYLTNLHKWYFAPKSSAVLYVRRDRQLPHVPVPSVVDNAETNVTFTDRFVWAGTRDRSAFCAVQEAITFRESLGGETAIMDYTYQLADFAGKYLMNLWQVEPLAPNSMHSSMVTVRIPTMDASICAAVRSTLFNMGYSVSGWAPLPSVAQCYFRLSAQVYLDQTDFMTIGQLTLDIIKNHTNAAPALVEGHFDRSSGRDAPKRECTDHTRVATNDQPVGIRNV